MNKVIFEKWRRAVGWKADVVRISHRRLIINDFAVDVEVVLLLAGCAVVELDGRSVDYVAGKQIPRFFPVFLAPPEGWRIRRYVSRVVEAVEAALPWFDQFATPDSCERMLLEGKTVQGKHSGIAPFEKCLEYLGRIRGTERRDK